MGKGNMSYDDEPYWPTKTKPDGRSLPWAHQVLEKAKETGRAPKASPILEEYMKKQLEKMNDKA